MAASKRKHAATSDRQADARRKRTKVPQSATQLAWRAINDKAGAGKLVGMERFVGLCAYLCSILQRGYTINESELDLFIMNHNAYTKALPGILSELEQASSSAVPSYHQWLLPHLTHVGSPATRAVSSTSITIVLTDRSLRDIWREHPFTFIKAHAGLNSIQDEVEGTRIRRTLSQARDSTALSPPEHSTISLRPCCAPCARIYLEHPDLVCDPRMVDDKSTDEGKDSTVNAANGSTDAEDNTACAECRSRRRRCTKVPQSCAAELAELQRRATDYTLNNEPLLTLTTFRSLQKAHADFIGKCKPNKGGRKPKAVTDNSETNTATEDGTRTGVALDDEMADTGEVTAMAIDTDGEVD